MDKKRAFIMPILVAAILLVGVVVADKQNAVIEEARQWEANITTFCKDNPEAVIDMGWGRPLLFPFYTYQLDDLKCSCVNNPKHYNPYLDDYGCRTPEEEGP